MNDYPTPKKGVAITAETSDVALRPSGVYRHKDTGAELITSFDPLATDAMSAAVERIGFEFVREARPDEIVPILAGSPASQDKQRVASSEDLKGIQARLSQLETENAELKQGVSLPEDQHGQTTNAAISSVKAQLELNDPTLVAAPVETEAKPLEKMNRAELEVEATKLGIENPSEFETKANLADAIKAVKANENEDEKESEEN